MNPPVMRICRSWTWATGGPPPRTHRYAYRLFDRDQDIWAWPGLHLVLRAAYWYRLHRWALERWGLRRGYTGKKWMIFIADEGGYYRDGHWELRRK